MTFRKLTEVDDDLLQQFYKDNPTEYLTDIVGTIPNAHYFGVFDDSNELIAVTSYIEQTKYLVLTQSTMVTSSNRGKGVGRYLNGELFKYLKAQGYGKIVCHIYVENLPSIILKLKLGYVIEGTLRDHDFKGQHEYVLGKVI